jgi:tetratricopeptide (TPR) repeat protein
MPPICTRDRRMRSSAGLLGHSWVRSLAGVFALVLASALPAAGCRAFRCAKASDESVAAARQLSLQGLDAQQRGHWDRAKMLFAAAVIQCPRDERARCGYAESLWQRGDSAEAIAHMEEAVALSGHDPERLVQLGRMYRERGDLVKAGDQARRAIAANPQLAGAWALQGEVSAAQGNRSEALASLHRALSYQPEYPEVQLAIAGIYEQENRPQRALATLQSLAASYAPGQVPAEVTIRESLALRALGRHEAAAQTLVEGTQRGNPSAELFLELARAQLHLGDEVAARMTLDRAVTNNPGHAACLALAQELGAQPPAIAAATAKRGTTTQ